MRQKALKKHQEKVAKLVKKVQSQEEAMKLKMEREQKEQDEEDAKQAKLLGVRTKGDLSKLKLKNLKNHGKMDFSDVSGQDLQKFASEAFSATDYMEMHDEESGSNDQSANLEAMVKGLR